MLFLLARRLLGALVVAAALTACPSLAAAADRSPRIVGGTTAAPSEFPYATGLEIALQGVGDDRPDALCGGSLVAARWIVTAAHCLVEDPVDMAHSVAIIGATDLNTATSAQRYGWANAFVDSRYLSGNGGSDVGVIELARPAPDQQVRLLRSTETGLFAPNVTALTVGWGLTEDPGDGGTLSTNALRKVDLRVYSDSECQQAFAAAGAPSGLDFTTEICALSPNKDSCNGDSGGPLLVPASDGSVALAGAVSFGIGTPDPMRRDRSCNEGPPGVYSRLGADPLNAFVRSKVPQVEIDRDVAVPFPGQRVTFTARPSDPSGTGPFGGYDALSWDLDGNGTFGEAAGQRSVSLAATRGVSVVSVRATSTAGDAEVRTVRVPSQDRSVVAFAAPTLSLREGATAGLEITRVGFGGGSLTATPSGSGVASAAQTVAFTGSEDARTVAFKTRGDGRPAPARRFQVSLGGYSGALVGGAPATATVTVVDDDATVRVGRVRGRRVTVKVRSGPGRLRVSGAATASRRVKSFGTHTLTARVRRARGRVTVGFTPSGLKGTVRRRAHLK
ncbi:MAG: S1 family peptidase [Solirubrobacteraceae bacterium]